jgi:FKBP-type peptidyl-prolyl cis-trans isomerase FklB|tara:strand:+ start:1161 stop:1835 length:675 start_codon:yes stop_codon:yes gene_type:complete
MKNIIFLSSLILFIACKTEKTNKTANLITELDSVSYSLGVNIGENIKTQFEDINLDNFEAGIKDVLEKDVEAKISDNQAQAIIQSYFSKKQQKQSESVIEEGINFLRENGKREGVTTLASGLQYEVINDGTGPKPTIEDNVTTHYHGTLIDGTVFDSSVDRGEPASFPVGGVIKGWTEALQLMAVGSKWKLYVPYDLAYGERGAGPQIGPYSTLIFDVELISIN